jgi:hypothetical protein
LEGEAEDLAGKQVADFDGDVLDFGEVSAPREAVGALGVAEHVFGGGLKGGCQRIQQLRCVLPDHELAPQEVTANHFPDFCGAL